MVALSLLGEKNPNPKVVVDDEKSRRRRSIPDANKLGQWLETWHGSTAKSRRREEERSHHFIHFIFGPYGEPLSCPFPLSTPLFILTFCSLSLSRRMLLDFYFQQHRSVVELLLSFFLRLFVPSSAMSLKRRPDDGKTPDDKRRKPPPFSRCVSDSEIHPIGVSSIATECDLFAMNFIVGANMHAWITCLFKCSTKLNLVLIVLAEMYTMVDNGVRMNLCAAMNCLRKMGVIPVVNGNGKTHTHTLNVVMLCNWLTELWSVFLTFDFDSDECSVVRDVMKLQSLGHLLEPILEPLVRKVVWISPIFSIMD